MVTEMVVVHDNGERIKLPDSWKNCSTEIFQKIVTDWQPELEIALRSRIKLFAVMLNRPSEYLEKSTDEALEEAMLLSTEFVYSEQMDFTGLPLPNNVAINGRAVLIPKDLGRMTMGQNIHVRQAMAGKDGNALISLVTAIYLQPIYDNSKFDYHRALELEKHILKLPIVVTYPIGFFFLNQLRNSGWKWLRNLNRMIQRKIENVQLSLSWLKFIGLTPTPRYHFRSSTPSSSGKIRTMFGIKNSMMSWFGYTVGRMWVSIPNVTALLRNL